MRPSSRPAGTAGTLGTTRTRPPLTRSVRVRVSPSLKPSRAEAPRSRGVVGCPLSNTYGGNHFRHVTFGGGFLPTHIIGSIAALQRWASAPEPSRPAEAGTV